MQEKLLQSVYCLNWMFGFLMRISGLMSASNLQITIDKTGLKMTQGERKPAGEHVKILWLSWGPMPWSLGIYT